MMENSISTGYREPMGVGKSISRGLCPKCDTPSVIEDMGDMGQCQNCGLFMGNNLKKEILQTRQEVLQVSEQESEETHELDL